MGSAELGRDQRVPRSSESRSASSKGAAGSHYWGMDYAGGFFWVDPSRTARARDAEPAAAERERRPVKGMSDSPGRVEQSRIGEQQQKKRTLRSTLVFRGRGERAVLYWTFQRADAGNLRDGRRGLRVGSDAGSTAPPPPPAVLSASGRLGAAAVNEAPSAPPVPTERPRKRESALLGNSFPVISPEEKKTGTEGKMKASISRSAQP